MSNWNPGLGFGLERIGLVALRWPVAFALLIVVVTAVAGWNLRNLRFEGDITAILPEESETYRSYFAQRDDFRDFSRDITVIVQSDRLLTAGGLEDLRSLQLDLSLSDVVSNVVTVFSLPDPDPASGRIANLFPPEIGSDAEARALVERALQRYPQARSLIAPERNTAVMVVTLEAGFLRDDDDRAYSAYDTLRQAVAAASPDDFRFLYTGLTPIGVTVVSALISDQLRLTVIGLLLGVGIAFYIFRSVMAAAICAVPPALTAVWSLGLFGFVGTPITYLSTVLPTLALILAFADGIVLYYRWQTSNAAGSDHEANLTEALRRVGPASALTSVTTVLAFLSFSFASGSALKTFSAVGMAVVAIAFMAVITSLPVACLLAARLGLVRAGRVREPALQGIGGAFVALVEPRPLLLMVGAIIAVIALSVVHGMVRPEYQILDYLPKQAATREAERLANEIIGGRSLVFITMPAAEPGRPLARANLERLAEIEAIATQIYPADRVFSLRTLTARLDGEAAREALAAEFDRAPPTARGNYMSADGRRMVVNVRVPSDQPIAATRAGLDDLRGRLDRLPYAGAIVITGFDVLMAREFTHLIDQLRTSLLIAILLGVVVIGVASRSPVMALAALTPNLLPVFSVEMLVWLKGGTINISEVIALTIAFGIAIDNAVHMINIYRSEVQAGAPTDEALRRTMREVGPALGASSTIICVSALVTLASALPMVPVLGGLMIATLLVAYFSNMAILPANILSLDRLSRRRSGRSGLPPAGRPTERAEKTEQE